MRKVPAGIQAMPSMSLLSVPAGTTLVSPSALLVARFTIVSCLSRRVVWEKSLLLAGQAIAKPFALELQLKTSGEFLRGLCTACSGARGHSLLGLHWSCYMDSPGSPTRV